MELRIKANNFNDALNIAKSTYDIKDTDIINFEITNDEVIFEVDTLDSRLELNKKVDDIIKTEQFSDSDIAFICSDNKVHTPKGSTLFTRIKELVSKNIYPITGFTNFIDASNILDKVNLDDNPVVYNNLILTKEGNLLKGSYARKINSEFAHSVIIIDSDYPEEVNNSIIYESKVVDNSVVMSGTCLDLDDIGDILYNIKDIPGIKRIKIIINGVTFIGEVK